MTEYIGNVPVSSIQNVQISRNEERDEIDLVDENDNVILEGSDGGQEVQIDFTLLKQSHPEQLDIETQRSETKELVSNDVSDNYFEYNGSKYFLSIGEVSVPESSDLQTIREGTITAKALPWPKHYPQETFGFDLRSVGDILFVMDFSGEPDIVTVFPEGEVNYTLDLESFSNMLLSSISEVDYSLDIQSSSSRQVSSDSSVDYTLEIENTIADMQESSVGVVQFGMNMQYNPSLILNTESTVNYNIDVVGSLDGSIYGLFGRRFGRSFGGN